MLPTGSGERVQPAETAQSLQCFHGPIFLQNLQREVGALTKALYHFTRLPLLPISLARIFVSDSLYDGQFCGLGKASKLSSGSATTLYVAFPDNSPFIYTSLATASGMNGGDTKSLREVVIDALPKTISKPGKRYILEPTSLSARSLEALVTIRGPNIGLEASGGWSVFADGKLEPSPLSLHAASPTAPNKNDKDKENLPVQIAIKIARHHAELNAEARLPTNDDLEPIQKRRRLVAQARFGNERKGLQRFEVRLESSVSRIEGHNADEPVQKAIPAARPKRKRSTLSIMKGPPEQTISDEEAELTQSGSPTSNSPSLAPTSSQACESWSRRAPSTTKRCRGG